MLSHQLLVFLKAAECGSFTKASAHLLITPASVMKHINTLEARLGITLFLRSKAGLQLTPAGQSLYKDAAKLYSAAQSAVSRAKNAAFAGGITIRVGSSLLNPSNVLTTLWAPLHDKYPQYRFRIIPFEDTKEQIIPLMASLGERIDLLIGAFNSNTMYGHANYLILGSYNLCVAVPKTHPLARKKALTFADLYGGSLLTVTGGDSEIITSFNETVQKQHQQINLIGTGYYYDMETFNSCEQSGIPMLTLDAWADVHPSLVTLPLDCGVKVSYGIMYAKKPAPEISGFLQIIKENFAPKCV